MAKQTINIGASPNDGTGTPLRTAFDYCNLNFTELYTAVGPSGNNIVVPGSATITGDLTVDTSTLKVDSANNRVGIGTATPTAALHVSSSGSVHVNQRTGGNGCFTQYIDPVSSNYVGTDSGNFRVANNSAQDLLNIQQLGVFTFGDGAGGTRMTLNSTGLGVGVSPTYKLDVSSSSNIVGRVSSSSVLNTGFNIANTTGSTWSLYSFGSNDATLQNSFGIYHQNGTSFLQITQAGNVGIGVTPSAWNSSYRGLQLGAGGAISAHTSASLPWLVATSNSFINSVGDWKFINNGYSTRYLARGDDGTQSWWTSNNGSAGGTVSYTQAMTLDASGRLLVGKTTSGFTTVGAEIRENGEVIQTIAASTDATFVSKVYSSTAAAYRFYVGLGGTVFATNTTISSISDARLKENVQDLDVGLNAILALKPRKFDWKEGKGKNIKGDRGFIAQEFETVFPNLIDEWADPAPEGEAPYKSVRQDLIPVLVKAIQELTARVQTLETR